LRLRKIASVVVVVLTILLIPRGAWVFTFVQHGESPKFPVEKISGSYCITLVGHYTNRDNFAAAGVRTVKWESDQRENRQAEMLAMRSAFLDWFVEEWARQGGARQYAIDAVRNYPFQPNPQSGSATPTSQCGGKK